jgi:hypothetical protein
MYALVSYIIIIIIIIIKETGHECVKWIQLAQEGFQW